MRLRVLLLNPPGVKTYIRDYYCSKISKTNYLFEPVDLLMLSGTLSSRHDLRVIDAIAEALSPEECRNEIDSWGPDVIVSLIGAVSLHEDLLFLKGIAVGRRRIIVSGDVMLEEPASLFERYPFIDGAILDFTSSEILDYLDGNCDDLQMMVFRRGGKTIHPEGGRAVNQQILIPAPRHDLFNATGYRFPFVRNSRFATVLTDYGCPFSCSFCIMSTLGYRYRSVDSVAEELRSLVSLGKREIFFIDQTFGIHRKRALELCELLSSNGFRFGWVCYGRVDLVDRELLLAMKGAGCHTIIFGVESASEEILKAYRKGYTKDQIRTAFKLCRESGIRTVATFVIGLPEETLETASETIDFLKELDCDYASFNVAVPRVGTALRRNAVSEGLIDSAEMVMDQSGVTIAMPTRTLDRDTVKRLRTEAIRSFYLRPGYLWRRLVSIRSWYELREQISEGMVLVKDIFSGA